MTSNFSVPTLSPSHPLFGEGFYVAATLQDMDKARSMIDALTTLGMVPTYDWPAVGFVDLNQYDDCATKEIDAVVRAPYFIGILPGKFGMQTELGAALACKIVEPLREVMLVSEDEQYWTLKHSQQNQYVNVFWHHPLIDKLVGEDINLTVIQHLMSL